MTRRSPIAFVVAAGAAVACTGVRGSTTGMSQVNEQGYVVTVRQDAAQYPRDFAAPVDSTWKAIPLAFSELGFKAAPANDGSERLYLTPMLTVKGRLYPDAPTSAYIDCGLTTAGAPAADAYQVTFAILAWASPRGDSASTVRVVVDGRARDRAQSTDSQRCTGTGRLERRLLDAIGRRVQR